MNRSDRGGHYFVSGDACALPGLGKSTVSFGFDLFSVIQRAPPTGPKMSGSEVELGYPPTSWTDRWFFFSFSPSFYCDKVYITTILGVQFSGIEDIHNVE